jgi:Co/Zn/Cd efflux system component
MDFGEKVLYHQIHPAKLAADVGGSLVSTFLMWRRRFVAAMLAAFVPAVVASALIIRYADLEQRKRSRFGRYVHRYMDWRVSALRFFGQVVVWVGAWYRVDKLVPIGVAIVVAAWASGVWRKPTN